MLTDNPQRLTEAFRAALPPLDAEEAEYMPAFRRMADVLLNKATLRIHDIPHRFTEIEFYFKGGKHQDDFAHCDPIQKRFGVWYFHRTGGEYRSGTYKGLDIAFGSEA